MTEWHAFTCLLNQPSNLATISTTIMTICRRATKHGSAAAFEGRIEASVRGCYAIMQKLQGPKAAALTVPRFCCRSEQSVIEHRALQKPPLDIAGVSLVIPISSVKSVTLMAFTSRS